MGSQICQKSDTYCVQIKTNSKISHYVKGEGVEKIQKWGNFEFGKVNLRLAISQIFRNSKVMVISSKEFLPIFLIVFSPSKNLWICPLCQRVKDLLNKLFVFLPAFWYWLSRGDSDWGNWQDANISSWREYFLATEILVAIFLSGNIGSI